MKNSSSKAIVIAVCVVSAAITIGILIRMRVNRVAGLPPTYSARDQDHRLSEEAKTANPVIAALSRYYAVHSYFPTNLSTLAVPTDGWAYETHQSGYTLSKKLGWDPVLHYRFESGGGRWVFEPGDGSLERMIKL